ncbi:MAG: N-acetylmuramoyl-L-alanine amidase [Legionellales bacterium]|nr:N-acetylmuramoyl-L-alanine amidase [Legionellales bacterium]
MIVSAVVLGCLLLCWQTIARAVEITRLRASHDNQRTRLVLDFSGPIPDYKTFTLRDPERVIIDLPATQFTLRPPRKLLKNTIVDDIRIGQNQHHLRLVFDLLQAATPTFFKLSPQGTYGHRLVIDLAINHPPSSIAKPATTQPPKTITQKPNLVPEVVLPHNTQSRPVIVVIDPGHGGKDPGATGPNGVREKDVVLAIARYLKAILNNMPGFKAELTRKSDYYITLRDRLRLARQDQADIFVSIHADAFVHARSRGASVFALSERGASSEAARWLAEKENYSELGGVNLANKGDLLRSVLLDLSQTATINSSLRLGATVLHQLDRITSLHHSRVEQARFVVLKSPDIPSILIETGFISNPFEERRLSSRSYQQQLANAVAQGVKGYFLKHPPLGSYFATLKQNIRYIVKRGDSLSKLAVQYQVSQDQLISYNKLSSRQLRVGQVLMIPGK